MVIVNRIMLLLDERGLNQKDLTDYLGLEKSTFSSWKVGKSRSYKKYIAEIAEFFGVSTDYLLGITDDPINYDEVDTSEFNQPVWIEILKQNNFDKEKALKQYWSFEKANEEDAMRDSYSANNDDIKIVARHLEEIPVEKREELIDTICRTIDMYKNAIGQNKKGG